MANSTRVIDWGVDGKQSNANGGNGSLFYSAFDQSGAALIARTNLGISAVGLGSYRISPAAWSTAWSGYERWDDGVDEAVSDFSSDAAGGGGSVNNEQNFQTVEQIIEGGA